MYVVTKSALIAAAAKTFRETYLVRGAWLTLPDGRSAESVHAALATLPAGVSEKDIRAITGDTRLTENWCDECGLDSPVTVCLGLEAHHPTETKNFCTQCLETAVALAQGAAITA